MTPPEFNPVIAYVAFVFWLRTEPARYALGMKLPDYEELLCSAWPGIEVRLFKLYREFGQGFGLILAELERELERMFSREQLMAARDLIRLETVRLLPLVASESDRDASLLLELDPTDPASTEELREIRMQLQRLAGREDLAQPAAERLESKYLERIGAGLETGGDLKRRWRSLARQAGLRPDGGEYVSTGPGAIVEALQEPDTWERADVTYGEILDRALARAKQKLQYQAVKESRTVPGKLAQIDIDIEGAKEMEDASPSPETNLIEADLRDTRWRKLFAKARAIQHPTRKRNALAILGYWRAHPELSQEHVARHVGLSPKTVARCLQELKDR